MTRLSSITLSACLTAATSCTIHNIEPLTPLSTTTAAFAAVFRNVEASAIDVRPYRGTLFALRTGVNPDNNPYWIRCPIDVSYRFETIEPAVVSLDSVDLQSMAFPVDTLAIASIAQTGSTVVVTFRVLGRFVLNTNPHSVFQLAERPSCSSASHFVQSIAVGTYDVAIGRTATSSTITIDDLRVDTHGCASVGDTSTSITNECVVPIAYELVPFSSAASLGPPNTNDVADRSHIPSAQTMPKLADQHR